jgi:hypothetical protein
MNSARRTMETHMTSSVTRIAGRGLLSLALGVALTTAGGVGTVLGAKPTPTITGARCTVPLYEGSGEVVYTNVSWEGLHPSRVVFDWNDSYKSWSTSVERPKGSALAVPTPTDAYALELLQGTVTVYGPHGIQLQRSYQCS